MLELRDVTKRYEIGGAPAVDRLSLAVEAGELVALVGPSGCGKTTTLRLINGLERADAGEVLIDGASLANGDLVAHRRATGYVIQEGGLLPHWNVGRNVGTVPRLLGWEAARVDARVDELLDAVGLAPAEFRERRPSQLSGGERQRVGIARALAAKPRLMLMDEPFGALDPLTRAELHELLAAVRQREPVTIVMVTHDLAEALEIADRVAVLRDGTLAQYATPAQLRANPADPWVERFLAGVLHERTATVGDA